MEPSNLLQVGFGFWPSKVLLSAVKLGVFIPLMQEPLTGEQLQQKLGLHPGGFRRFELTHLAGPCSAAIAYK